MIKLYDYDLSGNCYKVRLLLNILGLKYEKENIEFYPSLAHREPEFLEINPLGQLPVLDDGDYRLRDAQAILCYLAAKYDDSGAWYPTAQPDLLGEVAQWLAFAENLTATASAARLQLGMFFDIDGDAARAGAHKLFRVLDEHLWFRENAGLNWLASADHPTIADIACFPYVMLSEEGGISREEYPAIRRWTDRVKTIEGFISMPGIFSPGEIGH
jgi:glutathione S-transferase